MSFADQFRAQQSDHKSIELATREIGGRQQLERMEFVQEVLGAAHYGGLAILHPRALASLVANAFIRLRGENEIIRQRFFENLSHLHFLRADDESVRIGVITSKFGNCICELDQSGFLIRAWSGSSDIAAVSIVSESGEEDRSFVPAFSPVPLLLPEARLPDNQRFLDKMLDAAFERAAIDGIRIPDVDGFSPNIEVWLKSDPLRTTILTDE